MDKNLEYFAGINLKLMSNVFYTKIDQVFKCKECTVESYEPESNMSFPLDLKQPENLFTLKVKFRSFVKSHLDKWFDMDVNWSDSTTVENARDWIIEAVKEKLRLKTFDFKIAIIKQNEVRFLLK